MANQLQIRLRPVIRVFVSSTFTDLRHERDALQREVFPKLEQLCARRQFQFQAIDLRWGVPTEASLDHRTMRICFEELRRSQEISPQPNFLTLLSNRYGWRPLPEEVSEDEFRRLEQAASSRLDREILRAWYQRDENAVSPVYLLQSRKKNLTDGRDYTNDQVWKGVQRVLWDVINRAYPAAQLAGRFDHLAALDEPLPSIVRFQSSATEQEIWRGALGAPNARQHVLAFIREIENVEEFLPVEIRDFVDVDESGSINAVSQGALRELKQEIRKRLGEGNVIGVEHARLVPTTNEKGEPRADVTTGHLEELCARVHAALKDIITRQMDEYWGTSDPTVVSPRELELERSEHQRFGKERAPADSFVGRVRHLHAIHAYLHNDSNQPLVIHGASGCGKTALLARAAEETQKSEVSGQKPEVIVRFIGVTPRSSDVRSLLASLCQELRQRHPLESPLPGDVRELSAELNEHFKTATAQAPLSLFLDALDQLADTDNGSSLFWIPFGQLPDHVKLVVSCLSDRAPEDPASQPYTALNRRGLAEANFINLDALSEGEAQTLLFERWLTQARRTLNAKQAQCIRERLKWDACRQPLYLKVLFAETRLWRSDDPAPTLGSNVSELIGALFKRLGDPSNHGPTLECALGYIAAARRGLTEMEILEILYQDPDYAKFLEQMTAKTGHQLPDNPKRIPIAIWSRLRFDLAPYLTEHAAPGGTVLNFYHRQVAEFVRGHFLDTPLKRQQRSEQLAGYFHSQDYFLESLEEQRARAKRLPPTPRPANVRKVDELPHHALRVATLAGKNDPEAKEWDAVADLLSDWRFLEAKAEAGLVFELVGDFAEAVNSLPAERPKHRILKLLEEALARDIHFIARRTHDYPQALFQCLWNSCWWYDCPQAVAHYEPVESKLVAQPPPWDQPGPKLCELLENWRARKEQAQPGFVWLRSLRPPALHLGTGQTAVFRGHERPVLSVVYSADGQRIVTTSVEGTLLEWDALTGQELRRLHMPVDHLWAAGYLPDILRIVGLSGDKGRLLNSDVVTLREWDATTGQELRCLRIRDGPAWNVAYSRDGRRITSGVRDSTFREWDATTGQELQCFRGHESQVRCVAYSPNGTHIVSGSDDGTVRQWDASTGNEVLCLRLSKLPVESVAYSPDGNRIACGLHDHTLRMLDAATGEELRCFYGHEEPVLSVAYSPDGRRIVSGSGDKTVRVWEISPGQGLRLLRAHCKPQDRAWCLAYSPDGHKLVSVSRDGVIREWDAATGQVLRSLRGHEEWLKKVASREKSLVRLISVPHFAIAPAATYSADGRRILCHHSNTLWQWDAATGQVLCCFLGHDEWVNSVAYSPDGQRIASGSSDRTVRVWDAMTGQELHCLRAHESKVQSVAYSPDGRRILSGSNDKTVREWDAAKAYPLRCLRGHEDEVHNVAYSADGLRIVSGSRDMTVREWDAASGECLRVYEGRYDVGEIAHGPKRRPFGMSPGSLDTCIVSLSSGQPIAWFASPLTENITAHPDGRRWAAAAVNRNELHLIQLEDGGVV